MLALWLIALRDLERNRRRSGLTLLAVALGVALVVVLISLSKGAMDGSLRNSIRLETGHVQVRAASYEEEEVSLAWEDLISDPQGLAAWVQSLPDVQVATPVLWASGILGTREESVGVRVVGIDPPSAAHAPLREGLAEGHFLAPDDREGLLMGRPLAKSLGLNVGDRVALLANTSDKQPDEAIFTVRGLYDTGIPYYDETTLFLPLAKAQAFTRARQRASAVFILASDLGKADAIAEALRAPGPTAQELRILTWRDLNKIVLQASEMQAGILNLMNLVVLTVVAIVIANTLLMSVFERTREMGILAALGMKGRQILALFLLEAGILGLAGLILGLLIGGGIAGYLAVEGLYVGTEVSATATSAIFAYGDRIYARFSLPDILSAAVTALIVTLVAALYPASLAARMEPIEALRAL